MADNVAITPGTGATIAADDIGGVLYPRNKVVFGADGTATDVGPNAGMPISNGWIEVTSAGVSANNSDIMSLDVSAYRWLSVQMTGTFTGSTITVQGSNDNTTWYSIVLQRIDASNTTAATMNALGQCLAGPINTRYLRVRTTGYGTGTVNAVLELSAVPSMLMNPNIAVVNQISNGVLITSLPAAATAQIASAARTATNSSGQSNNNTVFRGVRAFVTVTSAGSGSITPSIEQMLPGTATWVTLLTGPAITANGTTIMTVYPGATPVANLVVDDHVGYAFRITITHNNANTMTYSAGANYLP